MYFNLFPESWYHEKIFCFDRLLDALVSGLAGRTWTGKEALLQAVRAVCVSCKDAVAKTDHEPALSTVCY